MRAIEHLVRQQRAEVIGIKHTSAIRISVAFGVAHARAEHAIRNVAEAYDRELARVRLEDASARVARTWLRSPASGLENAQAHTRAAVAQAAAHSETYASIAQTSATLQAQKNAGVLIPIVKPTIAAGAVKKTWLQATPAIPAFDSLPDLSSSLVQHKAAAVAATGGTSAQMRALLDGVIAAMEMRSQALADAATSAAYRSTLALSMQANAVDGWYWYADLGNACAGCTAMHGSFHTWDEDLSDHAHGNCMQVPYAGDKPEVQTGTDWLAEAGADTQRDVLGPAKYLAYQAGDLSLGDLASVDGGYVGEASLSSLGLDAGDYL